MPARAGRRVACLVATITVAVYVAAVAVHVLPPSPATAELQPASTRILEPLFTQRWTLFAPTPPLIDYYTLADFRVRTPSGATTDAGPYNITRLTTDTTREHRLLPPRLARIDRYIHLIIQIDATAERIAELRRQRAQQPPELRPLIDEELRRLTAEHDQNIEYRADLEETLARYLSVLGSRLQPEGRVVEMRARVFVDAIVPFDARHDMDDVPDELVLDSGWVDYVEVGTVQP